ncbi:MAG: 16S rRNA (cytidine(1402)-2'-O)-methyltransferase [Lachnospiraceae bacterium]|nr:16S rRNA (cytidine(1402)-2'-O)-methyltransferase [Lachnospiraceae bacterium]
MSGTLYLCATPIGNLGDITYRVVETLRQVSLIAAEDTRNSRVLLERYDIHTPMTSYHEHNAVAKGEALASKLLKGEDIALITDAGTPAISDPGEVMVRICYEYGIPVTSLPGPSAVITALTLSGMSARRFVYEGFLPREKKEREEVLESLKRERRTVIFYEAPHRLRRTLEYFAAVFGEGRKITLCRELTKKFETIDRTTIGEAIRFYAESEPRGEYVLVIEGMSGEEAAQEAAAAWESMSISEHVAMYEKEGHDRKEAMRLAAKDRGVSRRDIYQELLNGRSSG